MTDGVRGGAILTRRGRDRRPIRSGGSTRPPRNPVQAALGSILLAQWDVRYGVAANTWTDQVRGLVLTGVGAPTFAVDGANFNGLPVWQFVSASTQYLDTGNIGFDLLANLSPDLYVRFTWRGTTVGATAQGLTYILNSTASTGIAYGNRNAGGWFPSMNPQASTSAAVPADLNVHSWEWGISGGQYFHRTDRGLINTLGASPFTTTAAVRRASVAAVGGSGAAPADLCVAQLLICRQRPSVAQVTTLDALDVAAFNIP